jgi:hypothetical protein
MIYTFKRIVRGGTRGSEAGRVELAVTRLIVHVYPQSTVWDSVPLLAYSVGRADDPAQQRKVSTGEVAEGFDRRVVDDGGEVLRRGDRAVFVNGLYHTAAGA